MLIALLHVWTGIAAAASEGCTERVNPQDWAVQLGQVESAFARLDHPGFLQSMEVAGRQLSCLGNPVSPELAARYHRLMGLDAFVRHDEESARLAFAAARAADPMGALPPELLPVGHVARALSESASTPGDAVTLWVPAGTTYWFDGLASSARPSDRDTLLQVETAGRITQSAHLRAGEPLPEGVQSRTAHRAFLWLVGGLGAVGVAAVAGVAVVGL